MDGISSVLTRKKHFQTYFLLAFSLTKIGSSAKGLQVLLADTVILGVLAYRTMAKLWTHSKTTSSPPKSLKVLQSSNVDIELGVDCRISTAFSIGKLEFRFRVVWIISDGAPIDMSLTVIIPKCVRTMWNSSIRTVSVAQRAQDKTTSMLYYLALSLSCTLTSTGCFKAWQFVGWTKSTRTRPIWVTYRSWVRCFHFDRGCALISLKLSLIRVFLFSSPLFWTWHMYHGIWTSSRRKEARWIRVQLEYIPVLNTTIKCFKRRTSC